MSTSQLPTWCMTNQWTTKRWWPRSGELEGSRAFRVAVPERGILILITENHGFSPEKSSKNGWTSMNQEPFVEAYGWSPNLNHPKLTVLKIHPFRACHGRERTSNWWSRCPQRSCDRSCWANRRRSWTNSWRRPVAFAKPNNNGFYFFKSNIKNNDMFFFFFFFFNFSLGNNIFLQQEKLFANKTGGIWTPSFKKAAIRCIAETLVSSCGFKFRRSAFRGLPEKTDGLSRNDFLGTGSTFCFVCFFWALWQF